jgi:S-adenosylmethionine:tRNA ribosyltransferase-isomerase
MMRADRHRFRIDADAPRACTAHATVALAPARLPVQRPSDARLLVIDAHGELAHHRRAGWIDLLRPDDAVVANDAATLPGSLAALHVRTDQDVEVRLAAHAPRARSREPRFDAVMFGAGDWRTRTEHRAPPPAMLAGDVVRIADGDAFVERCLGHPRLVRLRFGASDAGLWRLLATHGRPVQYAHLALDLAPWDVWTPIAGRPVAFEPPSAGFVLDWNSLRTLRARGIRFATLSHAAGLSSTGDADLDRRLPLDEPYDIPLETVKAIRRARERGGRVVAVGTSVVRALEHAACAGGAVRTGRGLADQRVGPDTSLRVVDALLTGTHEPGTSHYEMLRAFADGATLAAASVALATHGYRTHEFGDSMLVMRRT